MTMAGAKHENGMASRKIAGLLDAAETLIDAGADSKEIHRLMLAALRELATQLAGGSFEAATKATSPSFVASPSTPDSIAAKPPNPFEAMIEAEMQRQAPSPLPSSKGSKASSPDQDLGDAIRDGYSMLNIGMLNQAFERWLRAWHLVKSLAGSMRTTAEFDKAYPGLPELVFNWAQDFETELSGAGQQDAKFQEERLAYTREFVAQFPDEDETTVITFVTGQAEALWELGRRDEAERVYQDLIARFPDNIWPYIAWADQYWLSASATKAEAKEFGRGEALVRRALDRAATDDDRRAVLERLQSLYRDWGKDAERLAIAAQLAALGPPVDD